MFTKGLSAQTQNNLAILAKIKFVKKYYLAGGTGLSLHLGHRFSNDLDFFSPNPEKSIIIRNQLLPAGKLTLYQNDEGTFNGALNGIKLSFFLYPYPLLFPTHDYNKIKVADVLDIACMKIDGISSRGKKRDFIDLYFICTKVKPLPELIKLFTQKYKGVNYNMVHILKSLVFFEDAEREEEPIMIDKINWEKIKNFFIKEVRKIKF